MTLPDTLLNLLTITICFHRQFYYINLTSRSTLLVTKVQNNFTLLFSFAIPVTYEVGRTNYTVILINIFLFRDFLHVCVIPRYVLITG